jgi:hypothetical protein
MVETGKPRPMRHTRGSGKIDLDVGGRRPPTHSLMKSSFRSGFREKLSLSALPK